MPQPPSAINRRFITFEGADGCGKTTQLTKTAAFLRARGCSVVTTREPGDSTIGGEIRRLLLSPEVTPTPACELLLFLADRAQHVSERILPALQQGCWVLCDRYSDSTAVYQLAARKLERDRELTPLLTFAEQGLTPALTLWLDLPIATALHRIDGRTGSDHEGRLDHESARFHQAVHHGFAARQQQYPERIKRIDATGSEEAVQERIQAVLTPLLARD